MNFREEIERSIKSGMKYWAGNANIYMTYRWSAEPPTEPGWYWVVYGEDDDIRIAYFKDRHHAFLGDGGADVMPENIYHWLGPLPIPDQPEE